ncbi:retron St85 family RNA-directed DNA polymerase [Plesiomonas shigelloides]|uniref:retron St85 family RNA-directed DNA polymerase n=1 Tax=Plesiomonas shigelloides TaxID=703 RepID=UPI00387F1F8C
MNILNPQGATISSALRNKFNDIESFISLRPSTHYKTYKIPKRSIGFRTIAQPSKKLKNIQRYIVQELSVHIKPHSCAMAYVRGKCVVDNALVHKDNSYLLKLDIKNFFNSITPEILFGQFAKYGFLLSNKDMVLLKELCFWDVTGGKYNKSKWVLSVGAPSSPYLSNIIMANFDEVINAYCTKRQTKYSRYADDLTFSTSEKGVLSEIHKFVNSQLLYEFDGSLVINNSKIVYSSKAHNRHITGVTLANNNSLTIGRKNKKYIYALLHKFNNNLLPREDFAHLRGRIAFACQVEKNFLSTIKLKYGQDIISNLNNKLNMLEAEQ